MYVYICINIKHKIHKDNKKLVGMYKKQENLTHNDRKSLSLIVNAEMEQMMELLSKQKYIPNI